MDGFLRPRHTYQTITEFTNIDGCPEDDGTFTESCHECPCIDCIHDKKHMAKRQRIQARAGEMYRKYKYEKQAVREIAAAYRVSERTVKQALEMMNHARKENPNEREEE